MKKTLLSALGLAVALAFAVPALGTSEANAATTMAKPATTKIVHHKKHKKHHVAKHHKHHVKKHHVKKRTHKKHGMKHAA
ncbi:MAG: hypothetical protein EKK31_10600 [Hyphomicrobiales bacterium]|nr:MAG: hypothetical protein EKK31_10600 [Hyphomicrobiales bacterium]